MFCFFLFHQTRGHNRTLESFMVKNHPFTSTDQDDVFMKDDIIGQYSNNSYEVKTNAMAF